MEKHKRACKGCAVLSEQQENIRQLLDKGRTEIVQKNQEIDRLRSANNNLAAQMENMKDDVKMTRIIKELMR